MIDARRILDDLQRQAAAMARDVDASGRIDDARTAAGKLRERLETDPAARTVAAGAGGLLLLGLLGSKGGRNLVGSIAKTGIVAGLGALAYKAWTERAADTQGRAGPGAPQPQDLRSAGFQIEAGKDPAFDEALIHAMLGAAYSDGVIDKMERIAIEAALTRAGASEADRAELIGEMPAEDRIAKIVAGARSPNHAAELFAAAAAIAGETAARSPFLEELAEALGLSPETAAAIRRAAA
jgi:uncharacterized membrane protein YebE (DUF533 family)